MRRLSFFAIVFSFIGLFFGASIAAASYAPIYPIFDGPTEVRLSAALHEPIAIASDPTLKHRLNLIDIRTAGEDTQRLRGELG